MSVTVTVKEILSSAAEAEEFSETGEHAARDVAKQIPFKNRLSRNEKKSISCWRGKIV